MYLNSESPYEHVGNSLVSTLHINEPTITAENPRSCQDFCIFSPEANTRRRVRSSGMIPKKFNVHKTTVKHINNTWFVGGDGSSIYSNTYTHDLAYSNDGETWVGQCIPSLMKIRIGERT